MSQALTVREIQERKPAEFRHVSRWLMTRYRTADFASAQALVTAIGEAAEEQNHHPDLGLRWARVDVTLTSHDVGRLTERDLRLADTISRLAADAGAEPSPQGVQLVEWGLDTWASPEVAPFWQALLGYEGPAGAVDEVVDPAGVGPTLWFQDTDEHPTPRQRFHLDVWVDPADAEARIQAALASGGTLADDSEAPSFWVLADAQGNRACICTVQDRDRS